MILDTMVFLGALMLGVFIGFFIGGNNAEESKALRRKLESNLDPATRERVRKILDHIERNGQ